MDILEAIFTRRSIRKFTGEPICEEDLKTILKAGFYAPSANNRQPWHFIVLNDKEILNKIAGLNQNAKMLPQAGCGILVCGDEAKQPLTGFVVEDCSAAIQNMLLAAHGLGLGAVWCGIYPHKHLIQPISKILDLPEMILPVGLVAVGVKAEEKEPEDRYDERKIHFNRW